MTRLVNSSFAGVSVFDIDPNSISRERLWKNAIADTALVHDLVTGDNTPPIALDHDATGRGCPLGVPILNQIFDNYPIRHDPNSSLGQAEVALCSIFATQPPQETTIQCLLQQSRPFNRQAFVFFEVYTDAFILVDSVPLHFNMPATISPPI